MLFQHLRHLKNTFLRQRTRIVDFAAKGECSGKSETKQRRKPGPELEVLKAAQRQQLPALFHRC